MSFAIIAIVVVWVVLFGAAYLTRMVGGLSKERAAAIVVGSYLGLSALTLAWFGLNRTGLLSVIGMLLPCVAVLGMVAYPTRRL